MLNFLSDDESDGSEKGVETRREISSNMTNEFVQKPARVVRPSTYRHAIARAEKPISPGFPPDNQREGDLWHPEGSIRLTLTQTLDRSRRRFLGRAHFWTTLGILWEYGKFSVRKLISPLGIPQPRKPALSKNYLVCSSNRVEIGDQNWIIKNIDYITSH